MDSIYRLSGTVSYADVDRQERLLLSRLFALLQEAAIGHANQAGSGTGAAVRGESWMLNRMAIEVFAYPTFGATVEVQTWSSGIRGFRGWRDFRVRESDRLMASASSLWLYVDLRRRMLTRVPAEVAQTFPVVDAERFEPDLDRLTLVRPEDTEGQVTNVSVRYSDIDGNGHVNNVAYIDYLQSALARGGLSPRPCALRIKFDQEIPPDTSEVTVRLEPRESAVAFAITAPGVDAAVGDLTLA